MKKKIINTIFTKIRIGQQLMGICKCLYLQEESAEVKKVTQLLYLGCNEASRTSHLRKKSKYRICLINLLKFHLNPTPSKHIQKCRW